ncbi:pyocin knob domain-containing S74 family peptidase [Aeromonas hydrophila]|uniref:pyocin knob domain-containing S74 family peptidase n=1 Tax=Aeromonas hydrophila TaxID=644 RepID=UPI003EC94BE0
MAIDALKIDKVNQNIDAINGFKHTVNGKEVYHPDNKPSAADLNVVNKAGDTMSGNLTAPKVLVSTAQGTEANALTRKDYVDQKFAGVTSPSAVLPMVIDANKAISIKPAAANTAGSMSAADKVKLDGIQGFAVNGKSEKLKGPIDFDSIESSGFYNLYQAKATGSVNPPPFDYGTMLVIGADKDGQTFVTQMATDQRTCATYIRTRNDGTMAWTPWVKQIDEKGGALTGSLTIENNAPQIHFVESDNADKKWSLVSDGKTFRIHENNTTLGEATTVLKANEAGNTEIRKPISMSAQVELANALTRKDYVDAATIGFGLGSNKARSLSAKSCNDVDGIGFYGVYDGTTDTPYGTGPSGSMLIHQQWGTGDGGVSSQIFIAYTSDRMHIRRQYKGVWQPWVEVSTSANSIMKNSAGRVVDMIDVSVPDAMGLGKHSIRMNNGSIGGLNSISFNDPTEFNGEGIFFPKETKQDNSTEQADYDVLRAYNGVLYFNNKPTYGEWNKPTADDIQAVTDTRTNLNVDLNTVNGVGIYYQVANVNATTVNNYPVPLAGTLFVTRSAYGCQQEYTTFTGRKFQRGLTAAWNGTNGPWGIWTEFFSELTPSIKPAKNKNAIAINDKSSLSFQDGANTRFHLWAEGGAFRLSHGNDAQNPILTFLQNGDISSIGTFTAKDFLQSTAQSSLPNSSARKDYVDAQVATIDTKNVTKAGDTMTGPLNFKAGQSGAAVFDAGASAMFRNGTSNAWYHINNNAANDGVMISQGSTAAVDPIAQFASSDIKLHKRTYVGGGQFQIQTGGNPVLEFHVPGKHGRIVWVDNTTGDMNFGTSNGSFGEAARIMQLRSNGSGISLWGNNWAAANSHAFLDQWAQAAPVNVNFGTVGGGSDYYQIINGRSAATGAGYTTDVEFGVLRTSNVWGQGVIRIGSAEAATNKSQFAYTFDINGNFSAANVRITSDARLKSDFKPIENALQKVEQLTGKTYIKQGKDQREAGIIAQDLQKVLPESVGEFDHVDGNKYLSIESAGVNALLIEAIKELSAKVKELEAKGK